MPSCMRALVLLGFSPLVLALGCQERGSSGQDSRPLPTPEPPATVSVVLPTSDAPTPKKHSVATTVSGNVADVAPPVAGPNTAAPSTVASAAPLASAPAVSAPSAACSSRCKGAMQGCLSAPVDGGVPGFSNLELCKKALEACQSACEK